ncbi:DUF559 domain-containing protein [Pantoea ananatis]|uniref:endonuclease domain-containing protein n=1 Tax=Pantoea ananas TaxID=553 RepID=UPI002023E005|nr:DUF559 domain-containing protein [Pantoea ananatis]URL13302.1 DUF559 domain-containing protein [Pantoea ananatis]
MKNNIGKPIKDESPSWYRNRPVSYIEGEFTKELGDFANLIESETWFGDEKNHSRYRVDFILRDVRLIIELDGHAYHSTPTQLDYDSQRQRYLTRAGYSVIRFTGRQIVKDVNACVEEVRNMYEERLQREPAKYRVMYIDYPFIEKETTRFLNLRNQLIQDGDIPPRNVSPASFDELLVHAVEWLHERSHISVIVFYPQEYEVKINKLDKKTKEYKNGEIRISLVQDELYSSKLGEHMVNFAHLFDEFMLVGDDIVYIDPFRSVLPREFTFHKLGKHEFKTLENGKLLRRDNDNTSYVGSDLAHVRWQDFYYIIGASMGLDKHEM